MELKKINGWDINVGSDGKFSAYKDEEETIIENTLEEVEKEIERLRKSAAKRLPFWEVKIKPTNSNEKIMNEYIDLKKRKESLELEMKAIKKQFETYSKKEILENFGLEYSKG